MSGTFLRALLVSAALGAISAAMPAAAWPQDSARDQQLLAAQALRDLAISQTESGRIEQAAKGFMEAAKQFGEAGDDLERTKCLHNAGAMFELAGHYEQAITAFGQAQTWSARLRRADYAASSAVGRGLALGRLGRQPECIEALDIAVALLEQLDDPAQLALALFNRGVSQATLSRDEDAQLSLSRAEQLYRQLGDGRGQSWATTSLALVYESAERPGDAYAAFTRAIEITQVLGDEAKLGMLYNERGLVLKMLNRWEEALVDFDAAAPLLSAAGDTQQLARQAIYSGEALSSLGRFEQALAAFELAERRNPADDDLLAGYVLQGRGELLCFVGKYSEALTLFEQVALIMERHGEHRHLGRIATRQGEASRNLGHFGDALRFHVAAEAHYRRDGHRGYTAGAIMDRAELYSELGRFDEAMAAYDDSQKLFEEIHDREWLALVDVSRSATLRKAGRPEEAFDALERARPELEAIGNERQLAVLRFDRAVLLNSLGHFEQSLSELKLAEPDYLASGGLGAAAHLELARATARRNLGHVSRALAGYDRNEAILEELGLLQHLVRVAVLRGGLLSEQGRHAEALASYDAAAGRLADLLAGHVATLGEGSSSSLRAEFAPVVPAALDSAAALLSLPPETRNEATLARAWRVLEVFQGLGMAQLVAEQGLHSDDDLPLEMAISLEAARQALSTAAEQLVEAQADGDGDGDVAAASATLDAHRLSLRQRLEEARLATPDVVLPPIAEQEQVIAALSAGEALLHFSALGEQVHAFVVTPSGARLVPLGPTAAVDSAVEAVARRLDPALIREQPVPTELMADLRALGRLVLDPVLAAITEEGEPLRRLLIVPSGNLCRVPFEALLTADVEADADPKHWPYLVAEVAVTHVHSGTTWLALRQRALERQTRQQAAGSPAYVALAHPLYNALSSESPGRSSWSPLPRTADEVLAVARLLAKGADDKATLDALADQLIEGLVDGPPDHLEPIAGDDFLLLLRDQATEAQLKQRPEVSEARILHLACHGAADTLSPALSRLVLGPSPSEDGRLFVDDLARLPLSCDLLVLSACETNAGPVRALEGVDGLSRAGLAAGAQAVLSTLWQVQDDGARRLIVAFHEGWLHEGKTRIAALAHARRNAIAQGVPISTWAAFQLWDGVTGH